MRIAFVVLHFGRQGMEVVVEEPGPSGPALGPRRRLVTITWHQKEATDVPPADWHAMVKGELDFQDSNPMPDFGA